MNEAQQKSTIRRAQQSRNIEPGILRLLQKSHRYDQIIILFHFDTVWASDVQNITYHDISRVSWNMRNPSHTAFLWEEKISKTYSVLHLSQVCRVTYFTERHLLIEHIFLDLHPYSVRALPRKQARRFTVELQFNNCQGTNKILCKKLFWCWAPSSARSSAPRNFNSKGCRF